MEKVFQQKVFLCQVAFQSGAELLGIQQFLQAYTTAGGFVGVRRANATACGAKFFFAEQRFASLIKCPMIRQGDVRFIANKEPTAEINVALLEMLDFVDNRAGINDHSSANDTAGAGMENPRRDLMKDVFLLIDYDRVSGVCSALTANHHVHLGGQEVDDLAFALITPLHANDGYNRHNLFSIGRPD
jgi:hypothetical protein